MITTILYQLRQNIISTFICLALFTCSFNSLAQNTTFRVHVGLVYPISSNGRNAMLDTNDLSINLIAGISSVERGLSFAGLSNVVRHETYGSQFAGLSNHIGKKANGALFAGFANTYGGGNGAAFAGFANIAHGYINGVQCAGFANIAKNINGAQFAGFGNTAEKVSASQFAGFINVAKDVKGSQFAGFINIAKKVNGVQIAGFMNIAEQSDFPIGIVNIVKNGEKSIGTSIDENQTAMLTFRSGGRVLYGILGIGYNFKNTDEVYAFEAGFGAHLLQSNRFRVNAELTAGGLQSFEDGEYFRSSFKLFPALKLFRQLEIFVGPSLNFTTTNSLEGKALMADHKTLKTWQNKGSLQQKALSIGYTGGLHFLF